MRTLLAALIAFVSLLISPVVSAQSFGNHYDQTTQTLSPGQVVYLAIPRQGWPVNVQISAVDSTNTAALSLGSFLIVDSAQGNGTLTLPTSVGVLEPASYCYVGSSVPDGLYECGIGSVILVGNTDVNSAQPHKMYLKSNYSSSAQFHITMWY